MIVLRTLELTGLTAIYTLSVGRALSWLDSTSHACDNISDLANNPFIKNDHLVLQSEFVAFEQSRGSESRFVYKFRG
jgi:hypothetical protein